MSPARTHFKTESDIITGKRHSHSKTRTSQPLFVVFEIYRYSYSELITLYVLRYVPEAGLEEVSPLVFIRDGQMLFILQQLHTTRHTHPLPSMHRDTTYKHYSHTFNTSVKVKKNLVQ